MFRTPESTELLAALLAGERPVFHPNTGEEVGGENALLLSPAARAGLEVSRFCQLCGRRMVVQVRPEGWSAACSRHGTVDSSDLER